MDISIAFKFNGWWYKVVVKILNGDCREMLKTLPDRSIHCCVTSPPYYGLRSYCSEGSEEKELEIGLEQSPEEYVQNLVEVFREVKRVLRDDGTLWLNLGDSYSGSWKGQYKDGEHDPKKKKTDGMKLESCVIPNGLKNKDLIGIPWRVAFALQADGWYLRQDIIWQKNNPMPEGVKDRCTKSHEYIFLLTKSPKYFFDSDAIKEPAAYDGRKDTMMKGSAKYKTSVVPDKKEHTMAANGHERWKYDETGLPVRNKRSVWQINTKPYKGAHFATFNLDLIDTCLKAGTSEKGVCSKCGSPFIRIVEKETIWRDRPNSFCSYRDVNGQPDQRKQGLTIKTIGWKPSCSCDEVETVPAVVLDPFGGSGTVGQWCNLNGRDAILIELNPEYIPLIEERINTVPKPSKKKVTECIEEDFEAEEEINIEDLEKAMNPEEQDSYYNLLFGVPFEYFEMVRKAYWAEKGVV